MELWALNGGRYDAATFSEFATRRLLKRFLIVRQDTANGLVFDTIGEGLHVPERDWFRSAIGRPIEQQPDAPYWRWVAQIQRAALQANDPVVSDIDASIYLAVAWASAAPLPAAAAALHGAGRDAAAILRQQL